MSKIFSKETSENTYRNASCDSSRNYSEIFCEYSSTKISGNSSILSFRNSGKIPSENPERLVSSRKISWETSGNIFLVLNVFKNLSWDSYRISFGNSEKREYMNCFRNSLQEILPGNPINNHKFLRKFLQKSYGCCSNNF